MTATSLVDGEKPFPLPQDELPSETESLSSETPSTTKSKASAPELDAVNAYSLQGYHKQVVDFINKLFDISFLIRKASRNLRTNRSTTHVEKDAEGKDVLAEFKSMLILKIAGLYPLTPLWLVERLTDVVAKRRQLFYYQRAHTRRRANIPVVSAPTIIPRRAMDVERSEVTKHDLPITERTPPAKSKTTECKSGMKSYTTASEPLVGNEGLGTQLLGKPTLTEMRMNESTFPTPPKNGEHETFQCNQCFEVLPDKMRTPTLWRFVRRFLD